MSLILLMYLWIISFSVNMGVGALYCQYYVDVRQRCCYYYKNKYSFEPVVLNYEVVSWSVWAVYSQPLWLNKLQFKCARQKQAANVVPCKWSFLWFKVNNCHLKTLRCDCFHIFIIFLMVIVFAKSIKPPVMPLYSLIGWCMHVKSFRSHLTSRCNHKGGSSFQAIKGILAVCLFSNGWGN